MTCSFCHEKHRKVISSPSDSPRVYICEDCVRVCMAIVQDDAAPEPVEGRSLAGHPLADEALDALASWAAEGKAEDLARAREIVLRMLRGE